MKPEKINIENKTYTSDADIAYDSGYNKSHDDCMDWFTERLDELIKEVKGR